MILPLIFFASFNQADFSSPKLLNVDRSMYMLKVTTALISIDEFYRP
jgi:hypothetical protein